MSKIKLAAIKFGMFASGGTEKFLQTVIANLPKDKFEVDAYYTNAAPYLGSDWKHPDNDDVNIEYVKRNGVNIIPINVEFKDVRTPTHEWVNTDFYEKFDETKYDLILTARAGHSEAPYCHIKNTPIVEIITLPGMADRQANIIKSVHISNFQANSWINAGGDAGKVSIIPLFSETIKQSGNDLRKELNIPDGATVYGFHQRVDDGIFSSVSLDAYKNVMNENTWFIILGGSKLYSNHASSNNLVNFIQLPFSADDSVKDKFLATLNVYTHSRKDGETFGLAIAEAMSYGNPVLSHVAPAMGHVETIGDAGFVCNSIEEYSNKMKELSSLSSLNMELSKKSITRFREKLSLDVCMNKFNVLFDEILAEKAKDTMSDEDFWATL